MSTTIGMPELVITFKGLGGFTQNLDLSDDQDAVLSDPQDLG